MRTPISSIAMFLFAAILGAVGQFLYKLGAQSASGSLVGWITDWRILTGLVCYIGVTVLFVSAFRNGGQLTVLYPFYASTFVWALLIGALFLGEPVTIGKIGGILLIAGGMVLIAR